MLMVAPTGAGKTTIGAELARLKTERRRSGIWIAHRVELIDDAAARLESFGLTVGTIAASSTRRPNPYAPVQVASIQTLTARKQTPAADYLIVDEAHRTQGRTYRELLARYPQAQVFGLTATPERGDGKPLTEYDELITVATYSELLAGGWIVPCERIGPKRTLSAGEIALRPVDAYVQNGQNRPFICFSPTIADAVTHTAEFTAAGIKAIMVDGDTPSSVRKQALQDFKAGRIQGLVNVGVLTEGTDLPICACIILARGCGTEGLFIQITGRGLRPYPGKVDCLLIDLRGVSHVHGSPTEDRTYSLTGRGISHGNTEPNPYPACRVCGAPITPGDACAECGIEPNTARPLIVTNDPLVKYAFMRAQPADKRAATLAGWLRTGRERGWRPGAAAHKYKAVFNEWPSRDVMEMAKGIIGE